ncbi:MAG: hypothetical protein QGI78_03505 [Phycisphaerales bacterium]|jgi:type II secretory pathway pseudopilin PulG|nr:hypothetical protein [Phycisphaerales bacterium]
MTRRGLTLLEMTIAIGITAMIGAAIASMMAAVSNSMTSRDDGRRSAIQLATAQVRLAAYIAPARCFLDKTDESLTIWLDDSRESNTVHASEVRWLQFDAVAKTFTVKFVSFPEEWSQPMIDAADTECDETTDFDALLSTLEGSSFISTFNLIDHVETCFIWCNDADLHSAIRTCIRFSTSTSDGNSRDALIDESIRQHYLPQEQY